MDTTITIPDLWLPFILGVVTPLVTGLAVKLRAHPGTKALMGLVFVALAVVLEVVVAGGVTVHQALVLFATTFGTHVVTYYGLWKPVGGGDASPTMKATPNVGVG